MDKTIRVAFIYKPDYVFLTGNHFDNTTFDFFMKALKRTKRIDIEYFPEKEKIDVSGFQNKFDIILIPNNFSDATPDLLGINDLDIPVISRVGDPHDVNKYGKLSFHKKFKIDYYFNFMHPNYFYKYYPKNYNYKTIIFGLEPSKYSNLQPYKNRKKDIIVISGAIGKMNLKSRVANRILNPKQSSFYHYKLRTICNRLPYVKHARDIEDNELQNVLSKFCAAIAATTHYPTIKYMETSASGCLTFMEITKHNNGEYLGYQDGKTAIFINEHNFEKKFQEFLTDSNNPKWEKIAEEGRKYTLNELNNDKAVDSLVDLMELLISKK